MGQAKNDKWFSRAERYIELYRTKGHAAATEFLMGFGDKAEKVIDAIQDVREVRQDVEAAYRAELKARAKEVRLEKEILGNMSIDLPGDEKKEDEDVR